MTYEKTLQDIVLNEKGTSFNRNKPISFCLISPGTYRSLLENLGIQTLYHQINTNKNSFSERCYLDNNYDDVKSLESQRALNEFNSLGISLTNPIQINNFFDLMQKSKIPILSKERSENYPLIIGGGMGFANPLPYEEFFDVIFLGDAYNNINNFINLLATTKDKTEILKKASEIKGLYVPSTHSSTSEDITPSFGLIPDNIPLSSTKYTSDFASVIIDKGCKFGCDFCEYFYNTEGKYFSYPQEKILKNVELLIRNGVNKIFLYSASAGNHPDLEKILDFFKSANSLVEIQPTRYEQINDNVLHYIKRNINHLVLNPDTASDNLRKYVKRSNITNKDYVDLARNAYEKHNINNFSLHFIINYEGEHNEYMNISKITNELLNINETINLNIYINPLFPSPNTPLERHRMNLPSETVIKIEEIWTNIEDTNTTDSKVERQYQHSNHSNAYSGKRVKIHTTNEYDQLLEGILLRGNKESGLILYNAFISKENESSNSLIKFMEKNNFNWKKLFEEIPLTEQVPWHRFSIKKISEYNDKRYAFLMRTLK